MRKILLAIAAAGAGVEFIAENGGGPGVRIRKSAMGAEEVSRKIAAVLNEPKSTIHDDLKAPETGQTAPEPGHDKPNTRALLSQSDQNDWRTPRKFLDAAREVMGTIDLDPASGAEANETVQAARFFTEADDGLKQPWKGRIWLNPPYGGNARLFIESIAENNGGRGGRLKPVKPRRPK